MTTPNNHSEKRVLHDKDHHGAKRERGRHAGADETEQLIFTRNVATGAVVKVEKIDAAGKRTDITKDETVALAGKDNLHEIEAALDDAFEAGISSLLAPASEFEMHGESEEELELRRVLLNDIIGRDVRRRLQRRLVQRLVLTRTLPS